jgi:hypothetical protein
MDPVGGGVGICGQRSLLLQGGAAVYQPRLVVLGGDSVCDDMFRVHGTSGTKRTRGSVGVCFVVSSCRGSDDFELFLYGAEKTAPAFIPPRNQNLGEPEVSARNLRSVGYSKILKKRDDPKH